jgi:hypothetical protein
MTPELANVLLKYTNTEAQRELIKMRRDGATWPEVATKLKIDGGNGRQTIRILKERAAKQGYAPEYDMNHPVPEGFVVNKVSTLYDSEGNVKSQWVKSQGDRERQLQMLLDTIQSGGSGYKKYKPTAQPKKLDADLLCLLTITDFHLGMYAWAAEAGDDWDSEIARSVFLDSVAAMIAAAPPAGTAVLNQLGDFLHFDGLLAVTPTGGNILDADTRYGKLVDMSMSVMAEAVRMMLKKFGEVRVIQAEGNHDMAGSIWLRKHLKHVFADEPRVSVDDSEFPYYAYLHGKTMLGFHHGHKVKLAQMFKLFSSEPRFRGMWGQADHTYIHSGHLHHERVVENGGAIAEQHPTLSSRDAYAARGGWVSMRGAKMITYDKTDGEVHRITVRPRTI